MSDEETITRVQLAKTNKNPLVSEKIRTELISPGDIDYGDTKPPGVKKPPPPAPMPPTQLRPDSVGMAVALNSQHYMSRRAKGGGGRRGHTRTSPGTGGTPSIAVAFSSFGFPKHSKGVGKSAATRNADFQRTSKVGVKKDEGVRWVKRQSKKMSIVPPRRLAAYHAKIVLTPQKNYFLACHSSQAPSAKTRMRGSNTTLPKGTRNSSTSPRRGTLPGRSPKAPS